MAEPGRLADSYRADRFSFFRAQFVSSARATSARDFRVRIRTTHVRNWLPGQFLMLRWGDHIIGRPFAIIDWKAVQDEFELELWVRKLGAATCELFEYAQAGRSCEVFSPLGSALNAELFDFQSKVLMVTGGVGAASVLALFHRRKAFQKDLWLHGERSGSDLDTSVPFSELYLETPEGFSGQAFAGRVTAGLSENRSFEATHMVVCGPTPMLQAVASTVAKHPELSKLPCYLGLEEKMGCGIGFCFSCSVKTSTGMQRCCLEGPWFERRQIEDHFAFRGGRPRVG